MRITRKMLADWDACESGLEWFDAHFSADGKEYQEILNKLAEQNEDGYAEWLLRKAGAQDTVIELDEIVTENSFFFAGKIKVTNNIEIKCRLIAGCGIEAGESIEAGWGIKAGCGIEAGWGIKAGCGIEAGWGIKAGCGIEAGESIEAGDQYGIFAGLRIKINRWNMDAVVSAPSKPDNLISGFFVANGKATGGKK